MSDYDADAENLPETQLESDGDGSARPPRKTAVGASGPGPKPGVVPSEAQKSEPIVYESYSPCCSGTSRFATASRRRLS